MSATTEKLLEDIEFTKKALEAYRAAGDITGVGHLTAVLLEFQQRLNKANEALNEGASKVLKG
jgi:hypothetical protein